MAMMLPGVRPSMALASAPTFSSLPVFLSMATTEGSRSTTPFPLTYTRTEAVPRSIPMSLLNQFISLPHSIYLVFQESITLKLENMQKQELSYLL